MQRRALQFYVLHAERLLVARGCWLNEPADGPHYVAARKLQTIAQDHLGVTAGQYKYHNSRCPRCWQIWEAERLAAEGAK
jgi:hypothetical protein